jgi:hypothetical protein
MRCRHAGMRCRGCGHIMSLGASVCAGGDGLVHDDSRCHAAAESALQQRVEASTAAPAVDRATDDLTIGGELARYIQLEIEFTLERGSRMEGCILPRDDGRVFISFLRWAVDRRLEDAALCALWRAGSTLMARTRRIDLTADQEVSSAYHRLLNSGSPQIDSQQCADVAV